MCKAVRSRQNSAVTLTLPHIVPSVHGEYEVRVVQLVNRDDGDSSVLFFGPHKFLCVRVFQIQLISK